MSKKNVYIVEDMAVTRAAIASVLKDKEYCICGSAVTAEKAWIEIQELPVDIVILDLNLKGNKNGLWLAKKIRKSVDCAIVFLTAYGSDGILSQIYKTNPNGYIMKPFNNPTLLSTVKLALQNYKRNPTKSTDPSAIQYKYIRSQTGLIKISSDTILYLKSDGNYVRIFNQDNSCITTRNKLTTVLEQLSFDNVYRVHRRYAINAHRITSITARSVTLGPTAIPLSKSYQGAVLKEKFLKQSNAIK